MGAAAAAASAAGQIEHDLVPVADTHFSVFRRITRVVRDRLLRETGFVIPWPKNVSHLDCATTYEEAQSDEAKSGKLFRLGGGIQGSALLGFDSEARKYVAIKLTAGATAADLERERFVDMMAALPNVATLRGSGAWKRDYYQVTELGEWGTLCRLADQLQTLHNPNLKKEIIFWVAKNLLEGLHAIHKRRCVHRDVKVDNVLIGRNGVVRLIDFGCATQATPSGTIDGGRTSHGDYACMPPEGWHALNSGGYLGNDIDGTKLDMWGAGIILCHLAGIEVPSHEYLSQYVFCYGTKTKSIQIEAMMARFGSLELNDDLHHLINRLLDPVPRVRWSAERALGHPFFKDRWGEVDADRVCPRIQELMRPAPSSPMDLPIHRSSEHIERRDLREALASRWQPGELVVCVGPSGMGKTHLVRELVNDPHLTDRFELRFWISHASDPDRRREQLNQAVQELGIGVPTDRPEELLRDYLRRQEKPWIMVLDDAGPRETFAHMGAENGLVIATSRDVDDAASLYIGRLSRVKGGDLVRRRLGHERATPEESSRLAESLAGIPRSIESACAYIRKSGVPIQQFVAGIEAFSARGGATSSRRAMDDCFLQESIFGLRKGFLKGVSLQAKALLHALFRYWPGGVVPKSALAPIPDLLLQTLYRRGLLIEEEYVSEVDLLAHQAMVQGESNTALIGAMSSLFPTYSSAVLNRKLEELHPNYGVAFIWWQELIESGSPIHQEAVGVGILTRFVYHCIEGATDHHLSDGYKSELRYLSGLREKLQRARDEGGVQACDFWTQKLRIDQARLADKLRRARLAELRQLAAAIPEPRPKILPPGSGLSIGARDLFSSATLGRGSGQTFEVASHSRSKGTLRRSSCSCPLGRCGCHLH